MQTPTIKLTGRQYDTLTMIKFHGEVDVDGIDGRTLRALRNRKLVKGSSKVAVSQKALTASLRVDGTTFAL